MPTTTPTNERTVRDDLREFFETQYREETEAFIDEYFGGGNPGHGSFRIDWRDVDDHDPELADKFLDDPKPLVIGQGSQSSVAINAVNETHDRNCLNAEARVHGLPDYETYRVGDLRTKHLGNLVAVQGQVVKVHGVEPLIRTAAFECWRCGTLHEVPQTYGDIREPAECEACEQKNDWKLFRDKSDLIDFQAISVIPADTNLDDPPVMPVYLTKDLCDRVGEGDEVTVVGVYETMPFSRQSEVQLNTFVEAVEIDQETTTHADKVTSGELSDRLVAMVKERQDDGSTFGAREQEIIDELVDEGIREEEITDRIEDLKDDHDLAQAGPDRLMVP